MKFYVLPLCIVFLFIFAYPEDKPEQVNEEKPVTANEKPVPQKEPAVQQEKQAAPKTQSPQTQGSPGAKTETKEAPPTQAEADIIPLMKTVKLNFKEGKYDAADKAVDMAITLKPNDFDAVKYKAMIALKLGKLDIAEQNFNLALSAKGDDSELDFYLGGYYGKKGDFIAAEKQFLKYTIYGVLDPYKEKLRKYAEYVRPKADRARAKLLLKQEASLEGVPGPQNSIAVLSFANIGTKKELDPLKKGLSEMMITDLSQVSRLKVIERVQMQSLVDEMALGETGLLEEKNSDRMGKLLSAEKVVSGSYGSDDGKEIAMSATLSFSSTEGVIPAGNVKGAISDIFKLEKDLVFKTIKEMGIVLTEAERKNIEVIPTENILAFLAYSKGLDAEDKGDFSAAADNFRQAVKLDPSFSKAQKALTNSTAISDMGKSGVQQAGTVAGSEATSYSGAGEITTPVFTIGNLNFSSAANVSLHTINAVNVSFMPEKTVVVGSLARSIVISNPVTSQNPASNGNENHSYIDAFNIGFGSGTKSINARVPIPEGHLQ